MNPRNPRVGLPSEPELNECCVYQVKPGFVLREIAGEYLAIPVALADDEASRMAVLNEEGRFLWEQLQQERTISQLTRAMTDCYEVSDEEARADIIDFVNQLSENHLLLTKMEERK